MKSYYFISPCYDYGLKEILREGRSFPVLPFYCILLLSGVEGARAYIHIVNITAHSG